MDTTQVEHLRAALAGRYAIQRELGRGGMATVHLAEDLRHHRQVAIKVLKSELAAVLGPERFLREIEVTAGLDHPHILPLLDSGENQGLLYYVMPYVDGESLRDRLDREKQLPVHDAFQITREVADALGHAHARGIIHRDIKPENILLSGGHARVADFGIARAVATVGDQRLTETGLSVGTPLYASPEQGLGNRELDGRSDVYSLGCVLYEMLTGNPPFTGPTVLAILAQKSTEAPVSVRTVRPAVSDRSERVILRALAVDPGDRYATMAEFAEALDQARADARPPSRRRTGLVIVLAAGLLALAGVAVRLWIRQSRLDWVRTVALPEAEHQIGQRKNYAAYRLLRQAEAYAPDDPLLRELLAEATAPITVRTEPPGAQVEIRDFFGEPDIWERLGRAPLPPLRLPVPILVWRVSLEGYATSEVLAVTAGGGAVDLSLQPAAGAPAGMVYVTGGVSDLFRGDRNLQLDGYWLDQYEVSNRRFKEFVDRGGYGRREYWTEPFVGNGRSLTWEAARLLFRDRTGQPGPAMWELGAYPEGEEDHPVEGLSWYEAAAYCASVGKELPTIYHWYQAADLGGTTGFTRFGQFTAKGTAKTGHPLRLGGSGTYDMAGNVKEWVWNRADTHRRYILGGGYTEPSYTFIDRDAQDPLERRAAYGIRCARYVAPPGETLRQPVEAPFRDYRRETPVGDAVFAVYRSLYDYDRTPLDARVDSVDDHFEHWRVERVSFAAAYGTERVPALLFLPRNARPPFQTVVYYPGAGAFYQHSTLGPDAVEGDWTLFLLRSGRAVLFPVYMGTYERNSGGSPDDQPQLWRDVMIQSSKDLRRAMDYLATRADIDTQRLAHLGLSMGAGVGPIMTAMEPRFKASILLGGGLYFWHRPPEADVFNFLPRVKVPTLMINGRHDYYFQLESSQEPMFRQLGTPAADKRHRVFESGHIPDMRQEVMKEILDWLDRYLGPVTRQ